MRATFNTRAEHQRLKCPWCDKVIAGSHMSIHKRSCPERLNKSLIYLLTYGEAKEAGRLAELKEYSLKDI